jgi:hypothetical protein
MYVSSFDVQRSGTVCENSVMFIVGIVKVGELNKRIVSPWDASDKCGGGVVIQ